MIVDNIINCDKYKYLHPQFSKVFEVLASIDTDTPDERIEIDEDKAFVNLSSYVNKNVDECKFEDHKKYIDIQYVVSGEEIIDVFPAAKGKITEDRYADGDIAFFEDEEFFSSAYLCGGDFVIIMPGEAHRPLVAPDGVGYSTRKAVAKILL